MFSFYLEPFYVINIVMDYPRIRYIEALPIRQEGREMILLRDTEGIMENSLVVSKDALFLLSLMDGTRSLRDIQAEYMRTLGNLIYIEHIQNFMETLDAHYLLFNDNFKNHLMQLREEYGNEPVRKACLAGKSYASNKIEFLAFLDEMFKKIGESSVNITGILAPHIDYARGMEVYQETYRYLKNTDKTLIIILGTCHHHMEKIWSISAKDFSTPLDVIPGSRDLIRRIKENTILRQYIDEWPHRNEHSIELQLPLLQFVMQKDIEILPILTGSMHEYIAGEKDLPDQEIEDIIGNFKDMLAQHGKPYIIISGADLAHIGAQFGDTFPLNSFTLSESKSKDEEILEDIKNIDADTFIKTIQNEKDRRRICGLTPIYFQLRLLNDSLCRIVSYKQWTDGQSSVSFAGGIFYR
ncbi:MAG: AmmeMemoRadiSam system protein B [Proteobacteria bacterium]|nr:AmmeMemoRadiSam system protein B [Pseudomonadota bacterium]